MSGMPRVASQLSDRDDLLANSAADGLFMSIKPHYAERILAGEKTVELRRKSPVRTPSAVVIYGSGSVKAVMGTADLLTIRTASPAEIWDEYGIHSSIARQAFDEYFAGSDRACALVLENAREAERRIPLASLRQFGLEPPQSWRYISGPLLDVLQTEMFEATHGTAEDGALTNTGSRTLAICAGVSELLTNTAGLSINNARNLIDVVANRSLFGARKRGDRIKLT